MDEFKRKVSVKAALVAIGLLCTIATSGCKQSEITAQDTGNYPSNINAIVSSNCLGGDCHSSATRLNDSLDVTSWKAMMQTGRIAEVIPFRPLNSHLFQHLNNDPAINASAAPLMPLGRDALSRDDQHAFYDWIASGAPSFGGEIFYSTVPEPMLVIHQEQDLLSVIDRTNGRLARIFVDGNDPTQGLPALGARALASAGRYKKIFVGFANGALRSFDGKTFARLWEVHLPNAISGLAVLPDASKGYLITTASKDPGSYSVFDAFSLQLLRTVIDTNIQGAESISISTDGSRAYLVCAGSDDIKIINTSNDSIIGNIRCGVDVPRPPPADYVARYRPHEVALSSDGKTMWVSLQLSNEVIAIDIETKSITRRIGVGFRPLGLALTPDDKEVWVVNENSSNLSIIDNTSGKVVGTIDSLANAPEEIVVSPDGTTFYVTCQYLAAGGHHHSTGGGPPAGVFVLDRQSRSLVKSIELPPFATSILIP